MKTKSERDDTFSQYNFYLKVDCPDANILLFTSTPASGAVTFEVIKKNYFQI